MGESPTAAPAPLKKGAPVAVACDGYVTEQVLEADDTGGPTLVVSVLGRVERSRVTAR